MEDRIKQLKPKQEKLQDKIDGLKKEQTLAQNKQKAEQLQAKLKKLEDLSAKVEAAQKDVKEAKKIESGDIDQLRELRSEIKTLKAQIEGARLSLRITSGSDKTIEFTESGKEEEQVELASGKSIEKTASGGFSLNIDGVNVEVFSGEGDLENTVKELSSKEKEFRRC